MSKKRILVTSALPYVNNIPHLGTMVCIISADIYTRYLRLKKENVISVLGTDEHGTTTETIAMELGMTPKQAVDHFFKIHKEIYAWFNCSYDCLGRTSSKESKEITQDIFMKLYKNNYIEEKEVEQMYDEKADKFLSDRFIEGICPHCKYEEARGDQCDRCGKLLEPIELINPKSKLTGSKPVVKKTKHLFIKLDELQPLIERFVEERKSKWSDNALTTTKAWLREGLKERAITRDLSWGIPVPLKGYENKVFYVWFDAPIGYIAITKASREDWKKWWHNPEETKLVQFMGKDNIPFHTVLFPASLIGTGDKYTLLDTISVNEYLNYEDTKFSKSRGIGVFGDNAKETGIPADTWRYYITINRPETSDTKFTWKDLQEKINSDLVGNLGNLVNRTLTFIKRYSDGRVLRITKPLDYSKEVEEILRAYEDIELKKALKQIMSLSKKGNQYFQDQEPWRAIKEDKEKAANALAVLANMIKDLAILIHPVMPRVAEQITLQLNYKKKLSLELLKERVENHEITEPSPLFDKLEDKKLLGLQEKYSGKQEKESKALEKIDLRIAKITSVEKHPEADKLYIEKIDFGGETRTIVSGLVGHYEPEELIGKHVLIVYNLKPAKLRGVESHGMLLAVQQGKKVGILHSPDSKPGDKVIIQGIQAKTANEITIDEFFSTKIIAKKTALKADGCELKAPGKIFVDKGLEGQVK